MNQKKAKRIRKQISNLIDKPTKGMFRKGKNVYKARMRKCQNR